jgi:GNAT superfamily N-acetyltransferase
LEIPAVADRGDFLRHQSVGKDLAAGRAPTVQGAWLGRYIACDIESFFVAITEVGTVAGYLAGCLDNPAHNPRFADIGYYASFAPLCDRYPCHLHINLDERYRNSGIGSALIAAFTAQAASAGCSGIHVVTEERARNVRFYEKNEFRSLATACWNRADVVFMGRLLQPC